MTAKKGFHIEDRGSCKPLSFSSKIAESGKNIEDIGMLWLMSLTQLKIMLQLKKTLEVYNHEEKIMHPAASRGNACHRSVRDRTECANTSSKETIIEQKETIHLCG